MENVLRSGYPADESPRLFCIEENGLFKVVSRWVLYFTTKNLDEAMVVFEGLCMADRVSRKHARVLAIEARRVNRNRFACAAEWEWHVIRCAEMVLAGFRRVSGARNWAVVKWVRR